MNDVCRRKKRIGRVVFAAFFGALVLVVWRPWDVTRRGERWLDLHTGREYYIGTLHLGHVRVWSTVTPEPSTALSALFAAHGARPWPRGEYVRLSHSGTRRRWFGFIDIEHWSGFSNDAAYCMHDFQRTVPAILGEAARRGESPVCALERACAEKTAALQRSAPRVRLPDGD